MPHLRFLLAALLVAVLPLASPAQDTTDLAPARWALLLQVDPVFDFNAFSGASVSAERYLGTTAGLRFGVTLGGSLNEAEIEEHTDDAHNEPEFRRLEERATDQLTVESN